MSKFGKRKAENRKQSADSTILLNRQIYEKANLRNSVFCSPHSVVRYRRHSEGASEAKNLPPCERVKSQIHKKANFDKFRFLFSALR